MDNDFRQQYEDTHDNGRTAAGLSQKPHETDSRMDNLVTGAADWLADSLATGQVDDVVSRRIRETGKTLGVDDRPVSASDKAIDTFVRLRIFLRSGRWIKND